MPRRRYPHPLIYEQLCAERLFDPLPEESPVGKHYDEDGDGVLDHLETVDPVELRAESEQGWCEDRADPGSWDDPTIVDEPEDPHAVAD